jgi:hypothetical protein
MYFCDALHFYVVLCGNMAESIQDQNAFFYFSYFFYVDYVLLYQCPTLLMHVIVLLMLIMCWIFWTTSRFALKLWFVFHSELHFLLGLMDIYLL